MNKEERKPKEVSAGALVYNLKTDKYLAIRSSYNKEWGLPKGHIDKKDKGDIIATAKREVLEEVGLDVKVIEDVYEDQYYDIKKWGMTRLKMVRIYFSTIESETDPVKYTDKEVSEHIWLDGQSLVEIFTHKATGELVNKLIIQKKEKDSKL